MPWKITDVAQISAPNGDVMPGFNLQQEGRSPSVCFLFENQQKADKARDTMLDLLDACAAIVHIGR